MRQLVIAIARTTGDMGRRVATIATRAAGATVRAAAASGSAMSAAGRALTSSSQRGGYERLPAITFAPTQRRIIVDAMKSRVIPALKGLGKGAMIYGGLTGIHYGLEKLIDSFKNDTPTTMNDTELVDIVTSNVLTKLAEMEAQQAKEEGKRIEDETEKAVSILQDLKHEEKKNEFNLKKRQEIEEKIKQLLASFKQASPPPATTPPPQRSSTFAQFESSSKCSGWSCSILSDEPRMARSGGTTMRDNSCLLKLKDVTEKFIMTLTRLITSPSTVTTPNPTTTAAPTTRTAAPTATSIITTNNTAREDENTIEVGY